MDNNTLIGVIVVVAVFFIAVVLIVIKKPWSQVAMETKVGPLEAKFAASDERQPGSQPSQQGIHQEGNKAKNITAVNKAGTGVTQIKNKAKGDITATNTNAAKTNTQD